MVDDNSISDYLADGQTDNPTEKPNTGGALPPLKVMDETKYLDNQLGTLLLEIYDRGTVDAETLAEVTDRALPSIKRQIGELRKQGYLGVDYDGEEKKYFVSSDWGTQEFPSGPIIPLVYQYNLLSDGQRMEALNRAIEQTVDEGDVVADLGAGVGVLSYLAAEKAEKVYAIEMDREVYEKGKEIVDNEDLDNVEYIRGDAREIELPQQADVVLCELLDTGLIAELQVPVMNYAVENILADDGEVVPTEAQTSMRLVSSDYQFYGGSFRLPHFEEYGSRESVTKSDSVIYHEVDFSQPNAELVEERITLTVSEDGIVNGVQLNTNVRFGAKMEFTGASPWLDPPLTLPFERDIEAVAGDEITVEVSYELGGGLNNIVYNVVDHSSE